MMQHNLPHAADVGAVIANAPRIPLAFLALALSLCLCIGMVLNSLHLTLRLRERARARKAGGMRGAFAIRVHG